jgi:hypothetical protein
LSKKPKLDDLPDDQLEKLDENFAIAEGEFPSLFMALNVAQSRALKEMYTKEPDGGLAEMVSCEFANGVGKTTLMAIDIIGWTMGPDYLDRTMLPQEAVDFWNTIAELRNRGKLSMRLLCNSVDMKEQGSVLAVLKNVFPWAKMTKQDNTGCYKQIDIPHPEVPGIVNHIAVFTFDQEPDKHEGTTLDRVWVNENLPEKLFTPTSSRLRGGGSMVQFATILNYSSYLDQLESGTKFVAKRCRGHIYENCRGGEVTDEMADEVYREIGVTLQKNEDGPGYLTNGVLKLDSIEGTLESYEKTNPDEVQARKTGKPMSDGGRIFPGFDPAIHVVNDGIYDEVPEDWPMAMFVDPHPARPDAVIWAQLLPSDRLAIVDEWPVYNELGYYDKIKDTRFTLQQKTDIWREIESRRGYQERIQGNRVGDPNRFREPDEETLETLRDLYVEYGFDLNVDINDDFEYGRELVNQYLWYDANARRLLPNDPSGKPKIVIYKRCVNTIRAMSNFARKVNRDRSAPISESVDTRFECFCALVRYLVVWHQDNRFDDLKGKADRTDEYKVVTAGRDPFRRRALSGPAKIHGRPVVGSYQY